MKQNNTVADATQTLSQMSRDELLQMILSFCKEKENPPMENVEKAIPTKVDKNLELDKKISSIFVSIGIPPHIKGYLYLRSAIKMCIADNSIISAITKRLYPDVAKQFHSTSSRVERAIRHAIEVCWNRGRIDNINNLFVSKVFNKNDRPTNGEFIALLADKLLLDGCGD